MNKRYYALYKKHCTCSFNDFLNGCIEFFLDVQFDCFREEREQDNFKTYHEKVFQELKKEYKTFDDLLHCLKSKKKEEGEEIETDPLLMHTLYEIIKPHYDLEKN